MNYILIKALMKYTTSGLYGSETVFTNYDSNMNRTFPSPRSAQREQPFPILDTSFNNNGDSKYNYHDRNGLTLASINQVLGGHELSDHYYNHSRDPTANQEFLASSYNSHLQFYSGHQNALPPIRAFVGRRSSLDSSSIRLPSFDNYLRYLEREKQKENIHFKPRH